ncbi:TBC1 domain family member 5-like isoform X1 [Penaeus japonicus]|uniref:TBC1 domain family member 5-like isoform X1 n=2 Tax=Penaeus japonicus TaxID=27405 RepID=UPI001C710424|nr:TBC1 domain family member 5-like isoform X1 [Penaeus japonicus]XP_042875471.1 TBC1 domain family member 5-like isoform X1 [Penaeus japonicus]
MERFRPLISQSSNFIDPLTASLAKDDDSVSVGEDPIICLSTAAPTERLSMRQEDHFSATQPTRVLGGGLPYAAEWAQICKCAGTDAMQSLGQSGEMRASRFRSVCWRIYLGVLPGDHTQWLKVIRDERERYEDIRHRLMITPGLGDETLDPLLNNPLSQHEQSPWNQYFEDSELKKLIRQDVVRTFPEVEFFQSLRIRDLMVTVLFCYARQNPDVSYRQGMHEVLAPLIFVLHCDHQAHQHAHEMDPTTNVLQEIMDEAYLEHDAYCLFEGVMKGLEPWYVVSETGSQPDPRSTLLNAQPFARPQDIGPTNLLVQKLTSIHDNLLQRHDSALYSHLARLEIPPQIYGIRWIRLLFGREFSLQDLLMVWDAIFSDCQTTFPLVDFLTIAMLSFIREPLLLGDYTTCLKFLMRYPAAADVQYIIQLALHLRNPKQHPRPPGYSSGASRHMPTVGGRPDIHRGPQTLVPPETTARSSSVPRTQQSKIKKRTTSGEQAPTAVEASTVRRLSSPNAFTDPLNAAVIFSNNSSSNRSNSGNEARNDNGCDSSSSSSVNNQGTTRASKVVSGLVRLGGKLGRPRDLPVSRHLSIQSPPTPSPNTVAFVASQAQSDKSMPLVPTMKELSVVRTKSAPVSGSRKEQVYGSTQSSDESDDDESTDKRVSGDTDTEVMTVEDMSAVCLGCAMKLSHHSASIKTRLAQLQVQPDVSLRTALDGISEVIETLTGVRNQLSGSTGTVYNGQVEECTSQTTSSLTCEPTEHHPLSHPLSVDEQIT